MIGQRLKNKRFLNKKRQTVNAVAETPTRSVVDVAIAPVENEPSQEEALEFIRTFVWNGANDDGLNEIKRMLQITAIYRNELMDQPEIDVAERFPFFFTNPVSVKPSFFFVFTFSMLHAKFSRNV